MKVIVLGGFLGSGKTTILLKLAEKITNEAKLGDSCPLVILENEIGEVSVDSQSLGGYEVRELFAGCICCTLSSDLTSCVKDIAEKYNPKYVIIEATGLAYPDKITDTIKQFVIKEEKNVVTVSIADASRWEEIIDYMEMFLLGQMKSADIMVLNKIDCVDEKERKKIVDELKELKPEATVLWGSAAKSDGDELIEKLWEQIR